MVHIENFQDFGHPDGHDYVSGSPHLKHENLRRRVQKSISKEISRLKAENGYCRVLEVGAGHGVFTETVIEAGGDITVTEMSEP